MDSPCSINTRQRSVRGSWPNPRVWCTSSVIGSHFGRPCCQLRGSVRCPSSLEIHLASGAVSPLFLPPWGVGLLPGAWGASFKRNADGARGIFRKCRASVGCSSAPGPTLKRPYAVFLRLVGRMINSVDQNHVTQPRVIPFAEWTDSPLPHWTLSPRSTNYCLTRFTCILFLLLEYMFFY